MTNLRTDVGTTLRRVREARGLTRADAGRALDMRPQSTIRLEQGAVSLDRLEAVGAAYGVTFRLVAVDTETGQPLKLGAS